MNCSVLHPLSGVDNSEDAVPLATFFDWKEDGVEDIMVVRNKTGGGSAGKVSVGAFTNATLSGDAYFVKIIVLSGEWRPVNIHLAWEIRVMGYKGH